MKSKFYLPLIAMAIGMGSCTNDLVEEVSPIMGQRDVIAVSVDNADTRTAMKDYNVVWSAGDAIGIFVGATNNAYALATGEGTSSAEFQSEGLIVASAETLKEAAYFPYVEGATWANSVITTTLPSTYEYAEGTNNNAVMAALMAEDAQSSISFQNAGALYAITVENIPTGYDKAVMTYLDNEDNVGIAGAATITFVDGVPTLAVPDAASAQKTITITFEEVGDKTFYFPMPVKTEGYAGKLQFSLQGTDKEAIKAPVFTKEPVRSNLYSVTLKLDNVSGGIVSEANDIDAANAALANDAVTSVAVKDATDTDAITIPAKSESAADVEHTIDLSEATLPSTGSVAIVVEEGSGEKATVEKLTVIVPEGAEAGSYTINAPGTTVTIQGANGTVIETIEATTAENTLIIGEGVTIKNLTIKKGNVVLKGNVGSIESEVATTITLGKDVTLTEAIEIKGSVTIDGGNNTITSSASRVIELKASDINVTMKNLKIKSTAVRSSGGNIDIRGINIVPDMNNVNLTLESCSVEFTDESAHESSFAVNQTDQDRNSNTITITGGTYNGANVINIWGDGHTVEIDGATLTCLYKPNSKYHGNGVRLEGKGVTLTVKNTTFEGVNAKPFSQKYEEENTIIEENNTNNAYIYVAKAGSTYYCSLKEAIAGAGADEVKLLCDITLSESIEINSNVTIDGGNNTITSSASRVIELKASDINVTMKNLKIESTAVRSSGGNIDIRGINIVPDMKNVNLTLEDCSVVFTDESAHESSFAVNQTDKDENSNTITITGGTYNGANVINIWGDGHTVEIDGATLTCLYKPNSKYHGNGVRLEGKGVTLTVKNTTFEGVNAKAFSQKYEGENTIDFDNNDNVNNTRLSGM